jgi:alkylation response protein AidB-like acyl-CoA dehydrogenase
MDFRLSPEQQALADSVGRCLEREYGFERRAEVLAGAEGFDPRTWRSFADLGLMGAGLAEADGGFGGGPVETMIVMEAFGRALVVEPFLPSAILSLQTLAALPAGTERDELIAGIVAGEILVAFAHGEAGTRGEVGRVSVRAEEQDGGWRISGAKRLVLGAPSADRLLVSARTPDGIALFLTAPDAGGLAATPYRTLDNMRAADLVFDNVPATLLAGAKAAMAAIEWGHDHALVALCAEAVGAMEQAILITRDYLKTRTQFGVPLAAFQALQHRMADMLVELEMSRSILFQGIAALAAPERERAMSAMKAVVSAAALFVGRNAVQLHGAIGMTEEHMIGHYYRRLFVIAGLFGGESDHLERMAAHPAPYWPPLHVREPAR